MTRLTLKDTLEGISNGTRRIFKRTTLTYFHEASVLFNDVRLRIKGTRVAFSDMRVIFIDFRMFFSSTRVINNANGVFKEVECHSMTRK